MISSAHEGEREKLKILIHRIVHRSQIHLLFRRVDWNAPKKIKYNQMKWLIPSTKKYPNSDFFPICNIIKMWYINFSDIFLAFRHRWMLFFFLSLSSGACGSTELPRRRQMCTRSIFGNVFHRFPSCADFISILEGGEKQKKNINKNFYPSRFILLIVRRVFFGGREKKM